jgi:hypothetical protein
MYRFTHILKHCLKMVVYSRNIACNYTPNERVFLYIVTEFIVISVRRCTIKLGWIMTSASTVAVQSMLHYRTS